MTPFRTEILGNGLVVEFFDSSNRYFGDYHRVCVEVRITGPPADAHASTSAGVPPQVGRLERMGVPSADVVAVRSRLAEAFWQHAGPYLGRGDYPARLAAKAVKTGGLRPGFGRT